MLDDLLSQLKARDIRLASLVQNTQFHWFCCLRNKDQKHFGSDRQESAEQAILAALAKLDAVEKPSDEDVFS